MKKEIKEFTFFNLYRAQLIYIELLEDKLRQIPTVNKMTDHNHGCPGNLTSQTLPMLNSGDMQHYVQGMNMSDVSFELNFSPPVHDLQIYDTSNNTHGHNIQETKASPIMCDSTHLPPDANGYVPDDSPPGNLIIIPQPPYPIMAPPCSEATIAYPAIGDYAGEFNFEILLDGNGSGFKAWMYSYDLNKVFIDIGKVLPIQVKILYKSDEPIPPLFLRATPVYSQDDFRGRAVERCPLHVMRDNAINEGYESVVKHIVRCTSSQCQYPTDERSGRHTCVTPLSPPQPGADTVTLMYSFVCKTSCLGGMDRRPVLLLLTLENQMGQIFGRRSLSVKVCACPKRDKEKEEKENSGNHQRLRGTKRKKSFDAKIKEEIDSTDASMMGTIECASCPLGATLAPLPMDHKIYFTDIMATHLAGMYTKKGNEACRLAAEKWRSIAENLRSALGPNIEPF